MFFKVFCALSVLSLAVAAPAPQRPTGGAGQVFTVTRVFKTLTDVSPFIVDATTTMTFTAGPSTIIAHPTGPGGNA